MIFQSSPVQALNFRTDPKRLQEELSQVLKQVAFHPVYKQISFRHRQDLPTGEEAFYDGVGSLWDFDKKRFKTQSREYNELHFTLRGGYWEHLIRDVESYWSAPLGRVRLMLRPPMSCYSLHQDEDIRLHLAIQTNPGCFMVFPESGCFHIPADGRLYASNTRLIHTAFNAGATDRVHLVFDSLGGGLRVF